jgi:hypothetical protein
VIDPCSESLIRLADVPKLKWLPTGRRGRRLHLSTLYRWQQRGLHGTRLETVQVGGTRCTTEAALLRFFAALQAKDPATNPKRVNQSSLARAERALDRAGIGVSLRGGAPQ